MNSEMSRSKNQFDPSIDYYYLDGLRDFKNWFLSIVEELKPDIIVGIARGAIRLLQLENINDIFSSVSILSDNALPFLDDGLIKNKRILIFDDSVIFGSTFSNVRNYIIKRGGIPLSAAYCVDRMSFYGESEDDTQILEPSVHSDLPIQIKNKFWPIEIRRHHDILTRSLLQTPNHYNLDFPTIIMHTSPYNPSDIPYICHLLKQTGTINECYDVATTSSSIGGVYRYTAILKKNIDNIFATDMIKCHQSVKVRISFVPTLNQIRITPILQLLLLDSTPYDSIVFSDHILTKLWRIIKPPLSNDPHYNQALFRVLTFYCSIILGYTIANNIEKVLADELPIKGYELLKDDIRFVVGQENEEIFSRLFSQLSDCDLSRLLIDKSVESIEEFPQNDELIDLAIKEWEKRPYFKPHEGEPLYDLFGKIFLTLRAITDDRKARMKNPQMSRIEVGFSKDAIKNILFNCCHISANSVELELALDMCVDNGQAVPKIINLSGIWHRAFYSGENEDSQDTAQLQLSLYNAYSDFLKDKRAKPLTQFDFHKLLVTLSDIFPNLPISSRYYSYGRCAKIGRREEELIPWLTHEQSGAFTLETKDIGYVIVPKKDFRFAVKQTWISGKTRDFVDGFHFIAAAFNIVTSDAKLLLSTCRTHRHTYNAVAYEAHSWVSHEYGNFETLLCGIKSKDDGTWMISSKSMDDLCWCAIRLSEAVKKYQIFHLKYRKLENRIMKAFQKQGSHAFRYYKYFIFEKNFISKDIDAEIDHLFKLLLPILEQMQSLTAYITKSLIRMNILSQKEVTDRIRKFYVTSYVEDFPWLYADDIDRIALDYNSRIMKQKVTGRSIEKTLLPDEMDGSNPSKRFEDTLNIVTKCFYELKESLFTFCPEYEVVEGDFPYAPDSSKRPLSDGRIERILANVYILAIDIIGSSNSSQTNEMKEIILQTIESFARNNRIYYEYTQNDCFIVCSDDVHVLIDIAKKVSLEGERLKGIPGERFGGTRKGIMYGTVSVIESTDKRYLIKDAKSPNIIPLVTSIITGLDIHERGIRFPINDSIITDMSALEKINKIINIGEEKVIRKWISSKHYTGRGYIFDLYQI